MNDYMSRVQKSFDLPLLYFIPADGSSLRRFGDDQMFKDTVDAEGVGFFETKAASADLKLVVPPDIIRGGAPKVFINRKVLDSAGVFTGVVGAGYPLAAVQRMISHYRQEAGQRVYFVDDQGTVTIARRERRRPRVPA